MKKVCLCDPCAKERGVTDPTGFSLADLLLGGVPGTPVSGQSGKSSVPSSGSSRRCQTCGFTLEDLRRVHRFGCSDCYATFSEEVGKMVRGMHKGIMHVGKVPSGLMAMQILHQRIEELRARLDQAITSENYEEAAGIRDEIQTLTETKV